MTTERMIDFSRRLGVDKAYVSRLGKEGRLVFAADGKVDVEASLQRIEETRGGRDDLRARWASVRTEKTAQGRFSGGGMGYGSDDGEKIAQRADFGDSGDDSRLTVRKMREMLVREDRLIDLGLLRGELMEKDAMERVWHDLGVALRAGMEALVERLAPRVAAAGSAERIAAEIDDALREEDRRIRRALVGAARQIRRTGK